MKLRVTHLITQLELGGAQRNTLYTLEHLDPERFEPSLICGRGGLLDEEAAGRGWRAEFVSSLVRPVRPWSDLMALIAIYRLLRRIRPHIVHTHSSKAGILGRLAAYVAGVPVIIHTFHGFGFTPAQRPAVRRAFVALERFCAALSTHLVFVSDDNRREALSLRIGRRTPGSLIRSGIRVAEPPATSSLRSELGLPADRWVVATVGNFKPQKNPMDLAKTASAVLAQDREVDFVLIGDGELRPAVEAYVREQGIADRVHFLGWRRDIPNILAGADAFLLTSLWEGLPRALVEAAAARRPSVAYAVNGVRELLADGENGFLIPPGETSRAAEKLLWLKAHPDDARRMGRLARERVEKEFDIDAMVRRQEELYRSLYESVPLQDYYQSRWAPPGPD